MERTIRVRGARTHNLKGLDLDIPKGQVVGFTGVSGSGKSSLVFDTLFTESQRQLVETFSAFSRRFLPQFTRPPVEELTGLGTAILVDQKPLGRTLRSTVGTATEVHTHLRMLYSRFGTPSVGPSYFFSFNNPHGMCPRCSGLGQAVDIDLDALVDRSLSLAQGALRHPDYPVGGWKWRELEAGGLFPMDKPLGTWDQDEWDRLLFAEAVPIAARSAKGVYSRTHRGIARRLLEARLAKGESQTEGKAAYERFFRTAVCPDCGGTRLNPRARSVTVAGLTLDQACALELTAFLGFLDQAAGPGRDVLVGKMASMVGHLVDGGAGYLSLDRAVATLSGGEGQRVKMARQLDCGLTDLVYVVDEPSTGLHPQDNDRLAALFRKLRDRGNSVLVVEHDPELLARADWLVEVGPGAGSRGGSLVYAGTPARWPGPGVPLAAVRARRPGTGWYRVKQARSRNLRGFDAAFPRGALSCVTGVSGSGKSTLVREEFLPLHPEAVVVDQNAIGRTSRGNTATYTGLFDLIRKTMARECGVPAGLLSFNSDGACPDCGGSGTLEVDLSFLDDLVVPCEACGGRRYRDEALVPTWKGRSIADLLDLTAEELLPLFTEAPIVQRLGLLVEVGLGYLPLGQSLSSLSGGERQRLKLASELHKTGNLYVLDEPTNGLHPRDIVRLLALLDRLVDAGNTVVVIEHNTQVMAAADWIVDLGPGGGAEGGHLLAQGTPEEVARGDGPTARVLGALLSA